MFWLSTKTKEQVREMAQRVGANERYIEDLEHDNLKLKEENERFKKQVIKYQAICREHNATGNGMFKPAKSSSAAKDQFKEIFEGDFYCLDDVAVDILNVFLEKINDLKRGKYFPSARAIRACDEFFKFEKVLTKRENLVALYALLDIKKTTRRFESFDNEVGTDELIGMIETLFTFVESHKQ